MPRRLPRKLRRRRGLWRLQRGWVRNSVFALFGILVTTVGAVVAIWFSSTLNVDQEIAATSAVLTGAALAVAVLAGFLAVLAYQFTTRSPNILIMFDSRDNADGTRTIRPRVINTGQVSATRASVMLIFSGAAVRRATEWECTGIVVYSRETPALNAGGTPIPLGSFIVTVDSEDHAAWILWLVTTDRVRSSGTYYFNPAPSD